MLFDDLTDAYEAMIDWPKRLGHEGPFYRRLFERAGVRRVVDVACGTGHHAAMFHGWNLRVEGADLSETMIRRARERFGEADGLRWVVRGFDAAIAAAEPFDAAVCVGNSLALATDLAMVERTLGAMFAAVRPGGAVVVGVLNLWRLADGPSLWQKCLRARLGPVEVLIHKGVRRCGARGYVELIVTRLTEIAMQAESASFLGLEAEWLHSAMRELGAVRVEVFGGYRQEPFVRDASVDLVVVAERGR